MGEAGRRVARLGSLAGRFADRAAEKNRTLIRYDIARTLRTLYDAPRDEAIRNKALELIETEPDAKYRKKYAGEWRH